VTEQRVDEKGDPKAVMSWVEKGIGGREMFSSQARGKILTRTKRKKEKKRLLSDKETEMGVGRGRIHSLQERNRNATKSSGISRRKLEVGKVQSKFERWKTEMKKNTARTMKGDQRGDLGEKGGRLKGIPEETYEGDFVSGGKNESGSFEG